MPEVVLGIGSFILLVIGPLCHDWTNHLFQGLHLLSGYWGLRCFVPNALTPTHFKKLIECHYSYAFPEYFQRYELDNDPGNPFALYGVFTPSEV